MDYTILNPPKDSSGPAKASWKLFPRAKPEEDTNSRYSAVTSGVVMAANDKIGHVHETTTEKTYNTQSTKKEVRGDLSSSYVCAIGKSKQ